MIDPVKVGHFIAELRKENSITQKQLGEHLGITDKAVSKWEHGHSLPDVSLIEPLCDLFQITISELLAGERLKKEEIQKETDKILLEAVSDRQIWGIQVIVKLLYVGGMTLWVLPFISSRVFGLEINFINLTCWIIGILLLISYSYLDKKLRFRNYRNSFFGITLIAATIIFFITISPIFADWAEQDMESKVYVIGLIAVCYGIAVVLLLLQARRNRKKSEAEAE